MALLFRGKSTCSLCGGIIGKCDDAVATPAFLGAAHRLARFSDGVFHRQCFDRTVEHAEVERLLSKFKETMKAAPKTLHEYETWVKDALKEFE